MKVFAVLLVLFALSVPAFAGDSRDAYGVGLDMKVYENPNWAVHQVDVETRWNADDNEFGAYVVGKVDLFDQLAKAKSATIGKLFS